MADLKLSESYIKQKEQEEKEQREQEKNAYYKLSAGKTKLEKELYDNKILDTRKEVYVL
ncbi:hypothetical protein [Mycobacterium sp.]|uniref:hypothetical protein n=1 Tax=Mycobacterium sp. TaxID=1785 RepID=UPI003A8B2C6E